jgi:hypothetical protein
LPAKVLIFIFIIAITNCKKEDLYTPPNDPKIAIIGEWSLIKIQGRDVPLDGQIFKFYNDSTYIIEYPKTGETFVGKYWIDSLLCTAFNYTINDTYVRRYHYKFYSDKMDLSIDQLAMFTHFTYKLKR